MEINIFIDQIKDSFEFLFDEVEKLQQDREKFFFIDKCMFEVNEKHDQIDCFYDGLKNKNDLQTYLDIEKKYINIFEQLWLYNKVTVYGDKDTNNNRKIKKVLSRYEMKYYKMNYNNNSVCNTKSLLDILVKIANRDAGNFVFYFENFKCLIVPLWSCYGIYFNDITKINIVEKIVNVNGLYLRHVENVDK